MKQEKVIERIMETAGCTLPKGASLWLYGSRARGDVRPDSDYDLLILLDKDELTLDDYLVQKPLRELGWDIGEEINPQVYSKREWEGFDYTLFYHNVLLDKRVLI
ncbi:MAG: nucleotidyltransferase domain-containing protein [Bacteroidales bacterium]|jgi:predicted nucleotidyltransferase|nr:nucleotidyltransferase domain-containing protein [Bacteroidales bacterium]